MSSARRERAHSVYFAELSRIEREGGPAIEELCGRHPDVAEELRQLDADVRSVETALRSVPLEDAGDEACPLGQRYRVIGEIGRGGMGIVYKVSDGLLRRDIAVKTLRPDVDPRDSQWLVERLRNEARITGQLSHPGVVPVHDVGERLDGRPFFSMHFIDGRRLDEVFDLSRGNREGWNLSRSIEVLLRACETLAYAHSRGAVHRDIKPSNVMVGAFGEVYVMDWGVAHFRSDAPSVPQVSGKGKARAPLDSALTRPGDFLGTPDYWSPEQARGDSGAVDERSDIYQLGVLLYHLLAGRPPRRQLPPGARNETHRDPAEVGDNGPQDSLASTAAPLATTAPQSPPELVAICERAMAPAPADRYPDASAMARDLRAFLGGRVVWAFESGPWAELRKWVGRNRGTAVAAALALLVTILGLGTLVFVEASARQRVEEEQRRTAAAAVEARRAQAMSALRSADYLGTRGDWGGVLEAVASAEAAGYADTIDLDLRRAEAWRVLGRYDRSTATLDRLLASPDLRGARRGKALLLRADQILLEPQAGTTLATLLEASLKEALGDADRLYAECLLAPTLSAALTLCHEALDNDPFHYSALVQLPFLLLLNGHHDLALRRIDAAEQLYPGDPNLVLARVLVLATTGKVELTEGLLDSLDETFPPDTVSGFHMIVDIVDEVNRSLLDFGAVDVGGMVETLHTAWTRSGTPATDTVHSFSAERLHPAMPSAISHLLAVPGFILSGSRTSALLPIDQGQAIWGDAIWPFLRAWMMPPNAAVNTEDKDGLMFSEEALAYLQQAADGRSVLPNVVTLARLEATLEQSTRVRLALGNTARDRTDALRNLHRLADATSLDAWHCQALSNMAVATDAPELALRFAARAAELAPADPTNSRVRFNILRELGAWKACWNTLDSIALDKPMDSNLGELRASILKSAHEWLAEVDPPDGPPQK